MIDSEALLTRLLEYYSKDYDLRFTAILTVLNTRLSAAR